MDLFVADHRPDRRIGDHDLGAEHPSLARRLGDQLLAEDRREAEGELCPNLLLLVGRKDIDDSIDRLDAVA